MYRYAIKLIDSLSEVAIQEVPIRNKLIKAIQHFCRAMELLILHRKLEADEMNLFQDQVDDFFEIGVEIFGRDRMAGHILYFLEKYECLYLYSQQGW
jgi:hypothetical protein